MLSSTGERLSEADLTGHDVLVIGGGNAALCAALSAREQGASVLLLESAPRKWRGGNSIHTRNLRCMHREPTDVLSDAYLEDEFFDDVWRVTGGITNEGLARHVIRASETCADWMKGYGVRFQPSLGGTLHLGRTNAFFLGGGKALVNTYFQAAERLGVTILYEAEAERLVFDGKRFDHALVTYNGSPRKVSARAVVIASGGFESNQAWLEEAWGEVSRNFLIRGTRFNQGKMLRALIDNGAKIIGDPTQGHAVAIDARAPKYDGGIVTRVDCVSLGIVVNRDGERFYDEGEDFWPKRYAIWGRLIAKQPGQVGYSITDAKAQGRFMPSVFPPEQADTLEELAAKLELPVDAVRKTVDDFNAAVQPGNFDHSVLDDCHTRGVTPEKTHWAQRIDEPPFYGYPLRTGITFTYLGAEVDDKARMYMDSGELADNVFLAGEIMAGNILGQGYVAGFGMTIGTVFGRIAGTEAGSYAKD
ncbi:FAD-dependent tricarballylate dehydrogenase TcuA [Franzmannia qiaohouensis]|uniref:FAD-dependent tricarballylate dehydrogenase TcuA n=1 Tax=Franzmannia qiaohouensis TaxID=1329370 RepID=A0ABU1HA35_9GAMM|nr:FAD-dependent tricarballylate dehydrogenase TcuA [Halomonas qiaohouensis]MDR5904322.1 FAD-dependent tricarballylate dehydrogenase TcuA [Halomonas qiaohouensis]